MFVTYPNKILCFYAGMFKPVIKFFFQKNIYNDRLQHTQIFYISMLKPVLIIF